MSDERCCASHCRPRTVNEQPEFRYGVIIAMQQDAQSVMAAAAFMSHVWPMVDGRLIVAMSDERCCASHCHPPHSERAARIQVWCHHCHAAGLHKV